VKRLEEITCEVVEKPLGITYTADYIKTVKPNSHASKAGMLADYRIVKLNGTDVDGKSWKKFFDDNTPPFTFVLRKAEDKLKVTLPLKIPVKRTYVKKWRWFGKFANSAKQTMDGMFDKTEDGKRVPFIKNVPTYLKDQKVPIKEGDFLHCFHLDRHTDDHITTGIQVKSWFNKFKKKAREVHKTGFKSNQAPNFDMPALTKMDFYRPIEVTYRGKTKDGNLGFFFPKKRGYAIMNLPGLRMVNRRNIWYTKEEDSFARRIIPDRCECVKIQIGKDTIYPQVAKRDWIEKEFERLAGTDNGKITESNTMKLWFIWDEMKEGKTFQEAVPGVAAVGGERRRLNALSARFARVSEYQRTMDITL